MNLDDLPDDLLVQVLDGLPCDFVSRSRCVSKRWFTLISNSACLTQKKCTTLFFCAQGFPKFDKRRLELFTMSERWGFREFPSVVLLPPSYFNQVVLATHNDFLLCKASNHQHQYNYYIYNPLTLEGFSVPPPPRWDDREAPEPKALGFLYVPNEHKWVVVRMVFGSTRSRNKIRIEIFSSKSGEWKEDAILSYKAKYERLDPVSIAYNGVLYWTGSDRCGHRYIFRLDGYSYHFILIDTAVKEYSNEMCCLGVCQGRLRMVQMLVRNGYKELLIFRIWELKEGKMEDGDGDEYKWCLIRTVVLDAFIVDDPPIPLWDGAETKLLALDPNHEEIVYLNVDMHVVTCNFGTRTVRIVKDHWKTNGNVSDYDTITAFPFAFSHLPTPTAPHHPPVDVSRQRLPLSNSWKQWPVKRFNGHCYHCGRYGHRIADCDIAGSRNEQAGARNSWRRQLEQEW